MGLLQRILNLRICPKAQLGNISEFAPLQELCAFGKEQGWSARQIAGTFLVARGVRGREGVKVLLAFCKQAKKVEWDNQAFVAEFYDTFDQKWRAEVLRTGRPSALSHQEHLHAGLSGRNFVETLADKAMVERLFGESGAAVRLAPLFLDPGNFDADRVVKFHRELASKPIALAAGNYRVQDEGARILGKAPKRRKAPKVRAGGKKTPTTSRTSYNAMDFTRAFSNVLTEVWGAPDVKFTGALWKLMISSQRKTEDVRELLAEFELDMKGANALLGNGDGLNWTTILILLCEVRQEIGEDLDAFKELLTWLENHPERMSDVDQTVQEIVQAGASSKDCYCVRVCSVVRGWMNEELRQGAPPLQLPPSGDPVALLPATGLSTSSATGLSAHARQGAPPLQLLSEVARQARCFLRVY